MRPDCVRRICAGALTLLIVCLASAHVKDILSEDVLDYTGYYDNLVGLLDETFPPQRADIQFTLEECGARLSLEGIVSSRSLISPYSLGRCLT